MAGEVQPRRPCQLVRPGLREGARTPAGPAEPHLLRHVGQRTVPASLRTSGGRLPLATRDAGVVPDHHRAPRALCTGDPVAAPAVCLAAGGLRRRSSSPPGRRVRGPGFLRGLTPMLRPGDDWYVWHARLSHIDSATSALTWIDGPW